jgi:hypothetical protein
MCPRCAALVRALGAVLALTLLKFDGKDGDEGNRCAPRPRLLPPPPLPPSTALSLTSSPPLPLTPPPPHLLTPPPPHCLFPSPPLPTPPLLPSPSHPPAIPPRFQASGAPRPRDARARGELPAGGRRADAAASQLAADLPHDRGDVCQAARRGAGRRRRRRPRQGRLRPHVRRGRQAHQHAPRLRRFGRGERRRLSHGL